MHTILNLITVGAYLTYDVRRVGFNYCYLKDEVIYTPGVDL